MDHFPSLQDRIPIGSGGLRVSPICLGRVGDPDTVSAAFDAGINFFFVTSDMHWPFYENLRRGLATLLERRPAVRDQIVVGAVNYCTQPEFCSLPFREVLETVPALERIDVLIAGGAYAGEFLDRLPVYQQHRDDAYVGARAIGVTCHERSLALQAANHALADIVFLRYNPDHPGARADLFPYLTEPQRVPCFNFTNTHGFLPPQHFDLLGLQERGYRQPRVTDYYRFALSSGKLQGLLVALSTPAEVPALAAALAEGPLAQAEQEQLIEMATLRRRMAPVLPGGR
ncbi:MAG: hypothetical protein AB7K24_32630 [Gemmataceae bacterium]